MDEFITFACNGNGPAASMLALMQETATKLSRQLIRRSLRCCRIRKINAFLIPKGLVLRTQMEIGTGHHNPLSLMGLDRDG